MTRSDQLMEEANRLHAREKRTRKRARILGIVAVFAAVIALTIMAASLYTSQENGQHIRALQQAAVQQAAQSDTEKRDLAAQVTAACDTGDTAVVAAGLCQQAQEVLESPAPAVGVPGARGSDGPTGSTGPVGATGPAGADGEQGDAGPAGPSGPPGQTGATGTVGATGSPGIPGPQGEPGTAGVDGTNGIDGQAGATGPAGPPGQPGADAPRVITISCNGTDLLFTLSDGTVITLAETPACAPKSDPPPEATPATTETEPAA